MTIAFLVFLGSIVLALLNFLSSFLVSEFLIIISNQVKIGVRMG